MGEDNLRTFHKWYNYEKLLAKHHIYVYPRVLTIQEEAEVNSISSQHQQELYQHDHIHFCEDAPVMKVSSSFIRQAIKEKRRSVFTYRTRSPLYRRNEFLQIV